MFPFLLVSAYTMAELKTLYFKARDYEESLDGGWRNCNELYRDKDKQYYQEVIKGDGILESFLKNSHGDPACPANGRIPGIFFHTRKYPYSIYGNQRLNLKATYLFNRQHNLYFCDFYCITKPHYVTLVVAKKRSCEDQQCRDLLFQLDATQNPFFERDTQEKVRVTHRKLNVVIFYASRIDLKNAINRNCATFTMVHGEDKKKSGARKNPSCTVCNIRVEKEPVTYHRPALSDPTYSECLLDQEIEFEDEHEHAIIKSSQTKDTQYKTEVVPGCSTRTHMEGIMDNSTAIHMSQASYVGRQNITDRCTIYNSEKEREAHYRSSDCKHPTYSECLLDSDVEFEDDHDHASIKSPETKDTQLPVASVPYSEGYPSISSSCTPRSQYSNEVRPGCSTRPPLGDIMDNSTVIHMPPESTIGRLNIPDRCTICNPERECETYFISPDLDYPTFSECLMDPDIELGMEIHQIEWMLRELGTRPRSGRSQRCSRKVMCVTGVSILMFLILLAIILTLVLSKETREKLFKMLLVIMFK